MKALSIRQPHAALIAAGVKRIETRSRATSYRGPVMIHASRGPVPAEALQRAGLMELSAGLPDVRGAYVARAVLTDCVEITPEYAERLRRDNPAEYTAGYYTPGRYAWILSNVEPLPKPAPARGYPWLWNTEGTI